jgi:hypothetical protein
MDWGVVYLVIAIILGILGIWNLARQRNIFLSIAGILWFLIVLFSRYISKYYDYSIVEGLTVGDIALFVGIPVFLVFAFFTSARR